MERHIKQITIGSIYLIITVGMVLLLWMFVFTGTECTDCSIADHMPLETTEKFLANTSPGVYDLVARVRNPNVSDVAHITYGIVVKDADGKEYELYSSKAAVLPNQTQYFIAPRVKLPGRIGDDVIKEFSVSFKSLVWTRHARSLPILGTLGTSYSPREDSRGTFGILTGSLVNNTTEAYPAVKIVALLYDEHGEFSSANFTILKNIGSRAKQPFTLTWSNPTFGKPADIIVEAYPE